MNLELTCSGLATQWEESDDLRPSRLRWSSSLLISSRQQTTEIGNQSFWYWNPWRMYRWLCETVHIKQWIWFSYTIAYLFWKSSSFHVPSQCLYFEIASYSFKCSCPRPRSRCSSAPAESDNERGWCNCSVYLLRLAMRLAKLLQQVFRLAKMVVHLLEMKLLAKLVKHLQSCLRVRGSL